MANDDALHRCVTKFMLGTCHHPSSTYPELQCLQHCTARIAVGDVEILPSGSSAEFRIKPIVSCIGDIDIMCSLNGLIAIPQGHTPPTELPGSYQHTVYVCEIIDSRKPGFVYLRISQMLKKEETGRYAAENMENGEAALLRNISLTSQKQDVGAILQEQFTNREVQNNSSVQSLLTPVAESHGPAVTAYNSLRETYNVTFRFLPISVDGVICVRCLLWPTPAANWPTRYRDHGWPDQATIDRVVSNGCDLVGAVHPVCRQDAWESEHQWRLSFSRAEVTLINSWTKVQQIMYHMLRFVLKREVLSKTDENEQDLPKLSNYHIKTLMLWECEQKPQSWWLAESSLIKLCSSLLHKLSDWVEDRRCQHYFISNCNLIDHFVEDASTVMSDSLRILANESILLTWFVENYMRIGAQYCPDDVSILFEDICSSDKLQRAVDAVVDWKSSTRTKELCADEYNFEKMTLSYLVLLHVDASFTQMLKTALQNFDPRFKDYFVAVISLRVAYTTSMKSPTEDILETLWTLLETGPAAASDFSKSEDRGLLCIQRAVSLATLSTVRSAALEMLHNEVSKAFLHHTFVCGNEFASCVVHVLLAVLYYKTGHYQRAIDHCKQVLNQNEFGQYGLQRIGAEYLPQIDETVDAAFGLVLLYQHVRQKALPPNTEMGKPAFTAQLLAHYIYSISAAVADSENHRISIYRQHLCYTECPLLYDILLFKNMEVQLECKEMFVVNTGTDVAEEASNSMDCRLLAAMLELVALEKLASLREILVRELHSEQHPVRNEFRALYSYKCGLLEECLDMCRQNVNMLLRAGCRRYQQYLIVVPEFLSILDGEVLSLFGIIRLLHPVYLLLLVELAGAESVSLLTLSVYLMVQCQKTLRSDSLRDTLQLIRVVHDKVFSANDNETFFDRLILKLIYRSLKLFTDSSTTSAHRRLF